MRKNIQPGSNEKDRSIIDFNQDRWINGIVNDPPAASIPDNSLADGLNVITYPKEIVPRGGTDLYTSYELPPLSGRNSYSATKDGYIITTDQNHFTEDDVGNYFVWPGTETEHDEIIRYISGVSVEVADSGTKDTTQVGCYLRGKINLWKFHSVLKVWLMQLGDEFWVIDITMTTWTRVLIVSRDTPNNAISGCQQFDEYSFVVWNSGGIFRIDLDYNTPVAYRINVPIPNIAISEQAETIDDEFYYGYIYGAARLYGDLMFRHRLTPVRIETETGSNSWGDDYKDYNDVWVEAPIGPSEYTYQKLTCATLPLAYRDPAMWRSVESPSFGININSIGEYQIYPDVATIETMKDFAASIQISLRDFFPDATCDFKDNGIIITSGRVNGGTVSYLTAGVTGTDISGILGGLAISDCHITTEYVDVPVVVGPLYVPIVANTDPQEYQWHFTHFPIYRTLDKNGLYKQGTNELSLNDPERYIWVKDLRICAAFFARKFNGHVLVNLGQFEEADVGSTIEWEDGSIDTILAYVAPDDVVINTDSGYQEESIFMACALGNGRVMRASQTGTTVTRTQGDVFSAADVRKPLIWSTGYRSIITAFVNANTVTVNDDYDKEEQGLTVDPVYRYFNDIVTDDVLRTRETSLLCKTRFLEAMTGCNVGCVVPGYMLTAQRHNKIIEYCQLPIGYEYLAGFHNKGYQIISTIKDDIQFILLAPNKFVALCTNSTWHGPTNVSEFVTMPKTGVVVAILGGVDILDGGIGNYDWGSIQEVSYGVYRMLTSEPGGIGLRDFNGFSFGKNLLVNEDTGQSNYKDSIEDLQKATASIYDGEAGYIIWGAS